MAKIQYEYIPISAKRLEKIELVNEILDEYEAQGYQLTLRQLYYQLVGRGYIQNNDREYANLGVLVSDGRMAGLIDWDMIVDITRGVKKISHWDSPKDIIWSAYRGFSLDKWKDQDNRVEVWIEKDAGLSIISRVCDRLDVPYFSCRGYTGQAAMWESAQRLLEYVKDGQQPVVIHLGDHDPSGIDMSRDIEERLDNFINTHLREEYAETWLDGIHDGWYDGIKFKRIALNWDQIQQYNPPPNPSKFSDPRSKGYVEKFGTESWELDALSPAVVDNLIETTILRYRNEEKYAKVEDNETKQQKVLQLLYAGWDTISTNILEQDASKNTGKTGE